MLRAVGFGLLLLAATLAMPQASAQATGALYFTNESLASPIAAAGGCPANLNYALAAATPTDGKAYWGATNPALACSSDFTFTAGPEFVLDGIVHFVFSTSCEHASVYSLPAQSVFRLRLFHGPDQIGDPADIGTGGTPCTGPTDILEWTGDITAAEEVVASGETLTARVSLWGSGPGDSQVPNFHILVGPTNPARIEGAGLPLATNPNIEAIGLTADKASRSVTAGGAATYNLTIQNLGKATTFALSTTGLPTGYTSAFNPLSGPLAGNATAHSVLKVTTPAGVPAKRISFQVKVTGAEGTNNTLAMTLDVAAASGGGGGTSGGGGGGTSGGGGEGTSNDGFTSEGETSGGDGTQASPGIEFALNVLAIGLLVVAMRRRNLR